jgi:hypothetical protein
MDFSFAKIEAHIIQRAGGSESLADMFHLKKGFRLRG